MGWKDPPVPEMLTIPRLLQRAFHLIQFGMLQEDDLFKVVCDPGLDEAEKRIPNPAPTTCRSTG